MFFFLFCAPRPVCIILCVVYCNINFKRDFPVQSSIKAVSLSEHSVLASANF